MTVTDALREVVDADGRVWKLGRNLGRGGQGDVLEVAGQSLAVKILHDDNPVARAALEDRLRTVRRLPLDDIPIAAPIVLLAKPHLGYVMRLIDGVLPLDDLRPSSRTPDIAQWYLETGGLRRRLRVLARLAETLEQLHSRAIVYGDLSLGNVLISEDAESDIVWLIDPDNLRYTTTSGRRIWTPGFGAPEVLSQRAPSPDTLTDAHGLAVAVYWILTLAHPLAGGAWADQDPASEERAYEGELPWVAHPDDGRNAQLAGLPWEMVLTKRAFALARRTFEAGLADPKVRASAGEWARELRWAAGMCISCARCKQAYFASLRRCSWCGCERPRVAVVTVVVCGEDGEQNSDKKLPRLVGTTDDTIVIRRAEAFGDRSPATSSEKVAHVRVENGRLVYEAHAEGTMIGKAGSDLRRVDVGRSVPIAAKGKGVLPWTVHFGEPGTLHRGLRLQIVPQETS